MNKAWRPVIVVSRRSCGTKPSAFAAHALRSIGIISRFPSMRETLERNDKTQAWAVVCVRDGVPFPSSYAILIVSLKSTGSTIGNTKYMAEQNNEKYLSVTSLVGNSGVTTEDTVMS